MCRSIKTLYNFDPPSTDEEIHATAQQYVRKVSGFAKPSAANEASFKRAVHAVTTATHQLLTSLTTAVPPHDREQEARRAHDQAVKRFGSRQA